MSLLNNIRKAGSKQVYLKALLTGPEGTGKSTSVLYGAERPLLVFDLERGSEIYSHNADFDVYPSDDPEEILAVTQELAQLQQQGHELPYKSFFIDSGTDLHKRIVKNEIKKLSEINGDPNKRSLEPKEYSYPNGVFYDIIKNLKKLDANMFVSAHAADNYLKGSFMQVDPNNPIKPDCHKNIAHEMDVSIILKKTGGKNFKIKAEVKKSRLDDKDGNPLLPAVIDNVDNKTLIKDLLEYARKDKGFKKEKPAIQQNVVQTDGALSAMVDEIIEIVSVLQMSNEVAVENLKNATSGQVDNPHNLNKEQAQSALEHFRRIREKSGGTSEG